MKAIILILLGAILCNCRIAPDIVSEDPLSTEEQPPSDDPPSQSDFRTSIPIPNPLSVCGDSSVWRFELSSGQYLPLTFQSYLNGNGNCIHRLVVGSICLKWQSTYLTTHPSFPMLPTQIRFNQVTGYSRICPNNIDESSFLNNILIGSSNKYQFSSLRNWVRIKGRNGIWTQWARHIQGKRKIWFT